MKTVRSTIFFAAFTCVTLTAHAGVQVKKVNADYTYVSGQQFDSKLNSDIVIVTEDISGGTGQCSNLSQRNNTVIGITVVADTVWMGRGSVRVGENYRNVFQATVGACLSEGNDEIVQNRFYSSDNGEKSLQEKITMKVDLKTLTVLSLKVEYIDRLENFVFEKYEAKLK